MNSAGTGRSISTIRVIFTRPTCQLSIALTSPGSRLCDRLGRRGEVRAGEDEDEAGDSASARALAEDGDAQADREQRVEVRHDERAAGAELGYQHAVED